MAIGELDETILQRLWFEMSRNVDGVVTDAEYRTLYERLTTARRTTTNTTSTTN